MVMIVRIGITNGELVVEERWLLAEETTFRHSSCCSSILGYS